MKPLKAEIDALAAVMMTPLEDFLTNKDTGSEDQLKALAQKRMFTRAIEAVDEARGARTTHTVVLRFGGYESSAFFIAYGPFATKDQATKALTGPLSRFDPTAYAVVPTRSEEGLEQLLASVDGDPPVKGDWAVVQKDRAAFKKGWRGKAIERDRYLEDA